MSKRLSQRCGMDIHGGLEMGSPEIGELDVSGGPKDVIYQDSVRVVLNERRCSIEIPFQKGHIQREDFV